MVELSTKNDADAGPRVGSGLLVRPTYASEESMTVYASMNARLKKLEREVSDHAQRFDTLQTPWWKRIWFKIDGWPYYDLNGAQRRRPWHRKH